MSINPQAVQEAFQAHFGEEPALLLRAPGRVNLIGEHTDYNDGFVLPMAIDRDTLIAARPREDGVLRIHSANFGKDAVLDLRGPNTHATEPWADYLAGVAAQLESGGQRACGADALILGDVPLGCGLSSSASLEMASLALFEALGEFSLDDSTAARLGQAVEQEHLGLNSGIMDQFVCRSGRAGHAMLLDCRDLTLRHVPVAFDGVSFVIGNTWIRRELAGSEYNVRVAECAAAVRFLREHVGHGGAALRDFTLEELGAVRGSMDPVLYRRAHHVLSENARTLAAGDALMTGDSEAFGHLMNNSDWSLREDYEVTCVELDVMTHVARSLRGCLGSRMTGAGFGGCTISLVETGHVEAFCQELAWGYKARTGLEGEVFATAASAGAGRLYL